MEKLKNIFEYIQKKFFKKKETTEEEIGNYSMNEGKADKVFGFRREVIRLTGVFFGAVLILALILASSEGESEKKEVETMPKLTESEIAEVQKPKNALPNDYETLMAMNKEKELELKRQAAENAKKSANQETVAETPPQMPVIPQGQYKVLPAATQIPKLPEETSENLGARVDSSPRSDGEKYKCAIAFALGQVTNQNQNSTSSDERKITSPMQVKSEYYIQYLKREKNF